MNGNTIKSGKCFFCKKYSDKVYLAECEDNKSHNICPSCLNKEFNRMYHELYPNEANKRGE